MDYELNETFSIKDDNTADWALRVIRDNEAERDRLISIAKSQIDELNEQIDEITKKYNNKSAFLKGHLAMYMQNVPHKETKTQESYQLLSGKLILKKANQTMVPNDDTIIKYLKDGGLSEYIKVKESLNWAELKKSLTISDGSVVNTLTGEIIGPDVIEIKDVPASFEIKLNKEE